MPCSTLPRIVSMQRSGVPIVAIASTSPKNAKRRRASSSGACRRDHHQVLEGALERLGIAADGSAMFGEDGDLAIQLRVVARRAVPDVGFLRDEAQHLLLAGAPDDDGRPR